MNNEDQLDQKKIDFFNNTKLVYDSLKNLRNNPAKIALRSLVTAGIDDSTTPSDLYSLFDNVRYKQNRDGVVDQLKQNRTDFFQDPSRNDLWGELPSSVNNTWGDAVDSIIRLFWLDEDVTFNDYSGRKYHFTDEHGNPACELKKGNNFIKKFLVINLYHIFF